MTQTISTCQTRDRRLCYEPQPTPDEVKAMHSGSKEIKRMAVHVVKSVGSDCVPFDVYAVGEQVGLDIGKKPLSASFSFANPFTAPVKGTLLLLELLRMPAQSGEEISKAYEAQCKDVAILIIVAQIDPGAIELGYLEQRKKAIGAHKPSHPAGKLGKEIAAATTSATAELCIAVVQSFNRGRARAYAGEIRNLADLESLLKVPSFKKEYDGDPAFRQGVLAAMDQSTRNPKLFAANVVLVQSQLCMSLVCR